MGGDLDWVLPLRTDLLTQFFTIFPYFASYYFFFIVIALCYWRSAKHKIFWLDLGFMVTLSAILNRILKEIFAVPRPSIERLVAINDGSYSFPSGDVQVLAVFWLMLAYHLKNRIMWALAIVQIILIAASRVYLGAHFPTDVITGAMIGALCATAYIKFGKHAMTARIKASSPIPQLIAICVLCIMYYLILQEHFGKVDTIVIGTLLGSWLGWLALPNSLCTKQLGYASMVVGAFATTILIMALKQLLHTMQGPQLLELGCYFGLAFFFVYLVPNTSRYFGVKSSVNDD